MLLKDRYSTAFYQRFGEVATHVIPGFDSKRYQQRIFLKEWPAMELKDRMKHSARALRFYMPDDFTAAAILLEELVTALQTASFFGASMEFMFLPHYVEEYGLDYPDAAIRAFEILTPFSSCEFAIRPFIQRYPEKMMEAMQQWARHPNHHVRRLASEGSRPRLPWGIALAALKKDPSPALPILQLLKNDPSDYVRRSVANHLNDIAKDNPAVVIAIARQWQGQSAATDAIIKHGCRSLLKQGHTAILSLYRLKEKHFSLSDIQVKSNSVRIGKSLQIDFTVTNNTARAQRLRLEYAIWFRLKNGTHYRKVFKISEREIAGRARVHYSKKHLFRVITTRTYYKGEQAISLILNGSEKKKIAFRLT
ncbi:MAG: DNA alkylation repair protein [Flavihumibacter sp.]